MSTPPYRVTMMSIFTGLLDSAANHFDDTSYPLEVYYYLISMIRQAKTPNELALYLSHAISWKDGKVMRDQAGEFSAQPYGVIYSVKATRPNTFSAKHMEIIKTQEFFDWAKTVQNTLVLDESMLSDLKLRFELWSSVVIPVFVLHCLNPLVFPIVDKWVFLTYRKYGCYELGEITIKKISFEDYISYQAWWLRVVNEAGIQVNYGHIDKLKRIDSGLWAVGKELPHANMGDNGDDDTSIPALTTENEGNTAKTSSAEFKRLAVKMWKDGKSQRDAITSAAQELGIELKSSYKSYPGSHFERWRKQGFI